MVEFILRSGDIDNRKSRVMQAEAMQEGSRVHRKIQRRMGASYHAEVPLKIEIPRENYQFVIEGRADGIIKEEMITIDEIKGIYMDLSYLEEPVGVHLHRRSVMLTCMPNKKVLHRMLKWACR